MTPTHVDPQNDPFLSIIAWPGDDRDAGLAIVAPHLGTSHMDLRMRCAPNAPLVIGQYSPAKAAAALEALHQAGGDGFAPRLQDLVAIGPALPVKDLAVENGGLAVELWSGMTTRLERSDIQILVRAHIAMSDPDAPPAPPRIEDPMLQSALGMGGFVGMHGHGPVGLRRTFSAVREAYQSALLYGKSDGPVKTTDKLDIHTHRGDLYRIDGDRFGFQVLGDQRGYSDKVNVDRLCELLAHLAPNEIVDPFFSLWRPPPGHKRLRVGLAPSGRRVPEAFEFYSRWVAVMYRHLLFAAP